MISYEDVATRKLLYQANKPPKQNTIPKKSCSGMWAMWARGLWWIRREERSKEAAFTTNSSLLSKAEDHRSRPPSLHPCACTGTLARAELRNVSNVDRGLRCLRERDGSSYQGNTTRPRGSGGCRSPFNSGSVEGLQGLTAGCKPERVPSCSTQPMLVKTKLHTQ